MIPGLESGTYGLDFSGGSSGGGGGFDLAGAFTSLLPTIGGAAFGPIGAGVGSLVSGLFGGGGGGRSSSGSSSGLSGLANTGLQGLFGMGAQNQAGQWGAYGAGMARNTALETLERQRQAAVSQFGAREYAKDQELFRDYLAANADLALSNSPLARQKARTTLQGDLFKAGRSIPFAAQAGFFV